MEKVEPKGLSEEKAKFLARYKDPKTCSCVCSGNAHDVANSTGGNTDGHCGCYCAGGQSNNDANKNGADASGIVGKLDVLVEYLAKQKSA